MRLGLGPGQGREQQGGQHGNDGHHHQEFDQGEGARAGGGVVAGQFQRQSTLFSRVTN